MSLERVNYQHLCLANCDEGPFLPLIALRESDELHFRNASVARILQPGRISDQLGGHRRLVQGSTVRLPATR